MVLGATCGLLTTEYYITTQARTRKHLELEFKVMDLNWAVILPGFFTKAFAGTLHML